MLKVALLVGGPSPEAGISLNSARSVADHLDADDVRIALVIYFDKGSQPYEISRALLYSNTPEDFDFKLGREGPPLSSDGLAARLRSVDIAFPVMHGEMGEDGQVQRLLESCGVPYVGSPPGACEAAYDKYSSSRLLAEAGLPAVPTQLLSPSLGGAEADAALAWARQALADQADARGRVVVKPARGGSSIGVHVLEGQGPERQGASQCLSALAAGGRAHVLQPYVPGRELTVVVVEGVDGPVALLPVEVERRANAGEGFLSYQDKYLASDEVRYYCPPRPDFSEELVAALRRAAEEAFRALGLRDFARIDCWALPNGQVLLSDVNPISGMEQNSYLFIQAAQAGMSHRDVLRLVLSAACRRSGVAPPGPARPQADGTGRIPVAVLFGGSTAERQVSVLSGTNVWLKLAHSRRYAPRPFLLSPSPDEAQVTVWQLSYPVALRHSVEAIDEACRLAPASEGRRRDLAAEVASRLQLPPGYQTLDLSLPRAMTMDDLLAQGDFVFLALHGGAGEDGTMQALLDQRGIAYNGPGPGASALCIDKYRTSARLGALAPLGVRTARKVQVEVAGLDVNGLWDRVVTACGTAKVIVKPLSDGCSAGVVPLEADDQLKAYLVALGRGEPKVRLAGGLEVAMPPGKTTHLLFEEYIESDDLSIADTGTGSHLRWGESRDTGWVEVTVGVLGRRGSMKALWPSITVARHGVLSLQEKFMGGTGVNITPPPGPPLGRALPGAVTRARSLVEKVAEQLGLEGYARIDAFMHRETGEVLVIEANSLPGLTPSTVLYHQALAEEPSLFPRQFLERVIDLGLERQALTGSRPTGARV